MRESKGNSNGRKQCSGGNFGFFSLLLHFVAIFMGNFMTLQSFFELERFLACNFELFQIMNE